MKKLIIRGTLFSLPVILCLLTIVVVDPFCYFSFNKIIPQERKKQYSRPLNFALWDMVQYTKNPSNHILIGDSRMACMNTDDLKSVSGKDFFMLSLGGGNLREVISAFNYITSLYKIESAYLGINFELYNKTNNRDRVSGAISVLKNPLLYLINLNVWQASYKIISSYISNNTGSVGKPDVSRELFWKYKIEETGQRNLANYIYPENYKKELQNIGKYCKAEGIDFRIIVFPTHTDIQGLFDKYKLLKANNKFLTDLSQITMVYDLNFPNYITKNKDFFSDPYHIKRTVFSERYISLIIKPCRDSEEIIKIYKQDSKINYTTFLSPE